MVDEDEYSNNKPTPPPSNMGILSVVAMWLLIFVMRTESRHGSPRLYLDVSRFTAISQVVLLLAPEDNALQVRFTVECLPAGETSNTTFWVDVDGHRHEAEFLGSANSWHYYVTHVRGLRPGGTYDYTVGHRYVAPGSPRTLRLTVPGPKPPKILFVGDTGVTARRHVLRSMAGHVDATVWVHVGDMSYASDDGKCWGEDRLNLTDACKYDCTGPACRGTVENRVGSTSFKKWESFFSDAEPLMSRIPGMIQQGNHDNDLMWYYKFQAQRADPEFEKLPLLQKQLHFPRQPLRQRADLGPVHLVSYQSEDNPVNPYERAAGHELPGDDARFEAHYGTSSPQWSWLQDDLARVDRARTPVVVAFSHRPLMHTSKHHKMCSPGGDWYGCRARDLYMPLMESRGVNLVVAGHSHHYMLTHHVTFNNTVVSRTDNSSAPLYAIVGTGGYRLAKGFVGADMPEYVKHRSDSDWGYAALSTSEHGDIMWEFVRVKI